MNLDRVTGAEKRIKIRGLHGKGMINIITIYPGLNRLVELGKKPGGILFHPFGQEWIFKGVIFN